jgi:hypothetical protein
MIAVHHGVPALVGGVILHREKHLLNGVVPIKQGIVILGDHSDDIGARRERDYVTQEPILIVAAEHRRDVGWSGRSARVRPRIKDLPPNLCGRESSASSLII